MGEKRNEKRTKERNEEEEKEEEEKEIVVVMVMSCVVAVGQCGCSVLIFICARQVGAAIPATLSDAVFTSTCQSIKSSNLEKETGRELKIITCISYSDI